MKRKRAKERAKRKEEKIEERRDLNKPIEQRAGPLPSNIVTLPKSNAIGTKPDIVKLSPNRGG